MLIRAALRKSREAFGGSKTEHLSRDIVDGLSLERHPMAIATVTALAADATLQLGGDPTNGRSSFTAIQMQIGGFGIAVNLDGRVALSDPDQLDAALDCLNSN